MRREAALLVTCEHGGNRVPADLAALFDGADALLSSHRGWDIGALDVALAFADELSAALVFARTTRLVIDLNRSLGHPQLFSDLTMRLDDAVRDGLIERFYVPYRRRVENLVRALVEAHGAAVHVSMHSFTDVLEGVRRDVDIGLLFDPERAAERDVCARWRAQLEAMRPELRIRFNEPYLGTDDGLTTHLRTVFEDGAYAGIEIEVRQGLLSSGEARQVFGEVLARSLPRPVLQRRTYGEA